MSFLAILTFLLVAGCGGDGGTPAREDSVKTLRFSAIPDQNSTELQAKFDPIAAYLSEALGINVEYVPSRDYGASVEMFKNGDIQLAWFGGLTGVQARQAVAGAEAIAQGVEDPAYYSYFIAHKDSGFERSDDFPAGIADVPFTFGSQKSTSGRLMPEHFIREASGKTPGEFFAQIPNFSGSHDKTAQLVQSGQFMAGALSYKAYDKLVASGKIDADVCRVIWRTPPYPDYNFTAHPDLETLFGQGFTDKLQKALVEMTDPKLLAAFPRQALIPAKSEDFQRIVEVATSLEMLR
jgi:phosphonate transport system substrate-binding protein